MYIIKNIPQVLVLFAPLSKLKIILNLDVNIIMNFLIYSKIPTQKKKRKL